VRAHENRHGRPPRPGTGLDDTDRAIIRELQHDGRRTYGRIAQAVGLSEAATRQRVGRLVKDDVIQIVAIVNPHALGYRFRATVGLECEGPLEDTVATLAEIDELDFLVVTAGGFDLLADLRCRDERHFYEVLSDLRRSAPRVRRTETYVHFEILKEQHPWPPGSGRRSPPERGPARRAEADGRRPIVLDDLDRGIIRELQDDGRRAYGRIAQAIGLSEPSTRQRVGHLVRADVIQIVGIINPEISHDHLLATVGVVCEGDPRGAAEALTAIDEVENLLATTGRFDFIAEVRCDDEHHLYRLVSRAIRASPHVSTAELFVHLHMAKLNYPWPPGFAVGQGSQA
jgi:Lrp/AsnC family transcriptional regulator for asnA, asnC and gidA